MCNRTSAYRGIGSLLPTREERTQRRYFRHPALRGSAHPISVLELTNKKKDKKDKKNVDSSSMGHWLNVIVVAVQMDGVERSHLPRVVQRTSRAADSSEPGAVRQERGGGGAAISWRCPRCRSAAFDRRILGLNLVVARERHRGGLAAQRLVHLAPRVPPLLRATTRVVAFGRRVLSIGVSVTS